MKVILTQDVKALGKKDELVNVKDGYARNYLFPKGLAVESSNENVNLMKNKKASQDLKKETEIKNANELKAKLAEIKVEIKAKSGEQGKLFGAISNKDISDNLKEKFNIEIDKKKIVLSDPIKSIGTFNVEIKLYPEISTEIAVSVVAEE